MLLTSNLVVMKWRILGGYKIARLILSGCTVSSIAHYAPINETPHLPPPGAGGGFANRGELNPHPWGPKFWLILHYFVYYLDIIT